MRQSIALIALFAVLFIAGFFISNPFILNVLGISLLTCIIVVGLNILFGFAGLVSLGHAGFVAIGGYVAAIVSSKFGIHPIFSTIIAALVSAVVAVIVGIPTLKLKGHYLAMATLAIGEAVYIVANNLVDITGGHQGFAAIPLLSIGGFSFDTQKKFYFLILALSVFFVFVAYSFASSRFGRALRVVHHSETAAKSFGINVALYRMIAFIISAVYASVAGSFYAFYLGFISPSLFDLSTSINYLIMVYVGGMGNIFGSIIAALFLTFLPNIFTSLQEWWVVFDGILLIIMVMFLPKGIGGLIRWKKSLY
ncbi:branched-chain amino acid ABC transporter permease [Hippea jasoniae]|uniref:branched-chain amino acid ABC transporter permease n=1 Tax=Hippea jasoniae TaxID=944479 RepID=UPI000553C321|nr:branched-chain amino acid ABC transporter permease [Hippea jasoniae]